MDIRTELDEALVKIVEFNNSIMEASNKGQELSDEATREMADYIANDFPKILFDANPIDAIGFVKAVSNKLPAMYVNNIFLACLMYHLAGKIDPNLWNAIRDSEDDSAPDPQTDDQDPIEKVKSIKPTKRR